MAASRRIRTLTAAGAMSLVLAAAGLATAAGGGHRGSLDSHFGHGGTATLGGGTRLFAVALQSDGKVVAVGESGAGSNVRLLLARFTASGSLDRKFAHGGLVSGPAVSTARGTGSLGRAVVIQSDGKIVVVGKATDKSGTARAGLLVERYGTNGRLDTHFGSRGVVNLLSNSFGDGYGVAIQPGGKVLAIGSEDAPGSGNGVYPRAAIVRLTGRGGLDHGFGHGGVDELDLGPFSAALAVALAPHGRIVIAGSRSPNLQATDALVARLTPSGALDRSFNGTGTAAHQYARGGGAFSGFNAVAVQRDGKIVAAGSATAGLGVADVLAVRLGSSGRQDGSFGSGGVAYAQSAANWVEQGNVVPGATGIKIAANGNIIAAGESVNAVLSNAALWAFSSRGRPDRGFGSNGVAVLRLKSGASSEAAGLALATSGSTVVAGDAKPIVGSYSGLVARVH